MGRRGGLVLAFLGLVVTAAVPSSAGSSVGVAALPVQGPVVVRVVGNSLQWFMRHGGAGGLVTESFVFGGSTDTPLWGDWDGNGTFTPGYVHGTIWHLRSGAGLGPQPPGQPQPQHDMEFSYGQAGDEFVVGDWDGNGTFTPGVVRGTSWYLRNSNSGGAHSVTPFAFGQAGDVSVVGDWDGNGTWTPGVRRGATWHLRNVHAGGTADASVTFGVASDAPMHSAPIPPVPTVTPIDWSRFTQPAPGDADAALMAAILGNTNRYAMKTWWHEKGYAAQTGAYLSFGGIDEHSIRTPANEAFALAVSLRLGTFDATTAEVSEAGALARAVRLAQSLARHHRANSGDGGWGDSWQSAMWSGFAGFAGWMLWEDLSVVDRDLVARMVEREADRLIRYPVPYYRDRSGVTPREDDSKAEENSWNAMILQLATAMMPGHPRRPDWLRKSAELEISAYSRPSDLANSTIVNGRPAKSWLNGSNINEDGVVINHGRAHPDYSTTVNANVFSALAHSLAGQPTERAAFFNADVVYDALVDLNWVEGSIYPPGGAVLPDGGTIYVEGSERIYYPHGNDWGTSRRIQPMLFDVQAHAFGFDWRASVKGDVWQRLHGQRVLQMQGRHDNRRTYANDIEDNYRGKEELVAATAAQAYLTLWILEQDAFTVSDAPIP